MNDENKEMIKIREQYVQIMREELLGPGSEISVPNAEHEIITENPEERYTLGVLYPAGKRMNADNADRFYEDSEENPEEETDIEETDYMSGQRSSVDRQDGTAGKESDREAYVEGSNLDEEISLASQNKPASMGIIFLAEGDTDTVNCTVRFGTYRRTMMTDVKVPFVPENAESFEMPTELTPYAVYDRKERLLRANTAERTETNLTPAMLNKLNEEGTLGKWDPEFVDCLHKLATQIRMSYIRDPHEENIAIRFKQDYSDANRNISGTGAKVTALRRKIGTDLYSVSIMLVNQGQKENGGSESIFQPEIIVSTDDNKFRFCDYGRAENYQRLTPEELSLEMQYRNRKKYATGMGTAAGWDIDSNGQGKLYTDLFPRAELPGMDFELPEKYRADKNALSMKYLSDLDKTDRETKLHALSTIAAAYRTWIGELKERTENTEVLSDPAVFGNAARENIEGCERSCRRMEEGLERLRTDDTAWEAFELANRAMFMQRAHINLPGHLEKEYDNADAASDFLYDIDYRTIDEYVKDYYSWRPFQIAFLLMSVNSIADGESPDKSIVDLIWFPTGGGKTEAYLGLTAFVIFYRRLKYPEESGGTAVIMRYTLRLLTAQQFTRASTLICACEFIRQDAESRKSVYGRHKLGSEPITIGLWIGGEHTPNTVNDAKIHEKALADTKTAGSLRYNLERHNKFQVLKCPWCGQPMVKQVVNNKLVGQWGYIKKRGHIVIACTREGCFFNEQERLPIEVVDEELYENPPTLLFGTVDKFAMMPWNSRIGAFFGIGRNARSPELIIQDELHLISGPLGTMVGMYESAIDGICRAHGNSPKIIASTATIRGAREQCSGLYNREVAQFPHPGLDTEDSFFARESVIDHEKGTYGREYVGLIPAGKTKVMAEDKVISALMQRIKTMDIPDHRKDLLWTLVVYFNSLKELGKCSNLVEDDIVEFIERNAKRHGRLSTRRIIGKADELTSRVSTTELNETLDKLEKAVYSSQRKPGQRYPSDIVLATNMISVGIDVARLNVMLMIGQPKLTSEYIQTSSRVGRGHPGVVFVLYDATKSRDRSHYEQFQSYHQSFYKYVEPTAVTPFSRPARDRALHAVLIAMIRNLVPELKEEKDAGEFSHQRFNAAVSEVKDFILSREQAVISRMPSQMNSEGEQIAQEIERIFGIWNNEAEYYKDKLSYGQSGMVKGIPEGEHRLLATHGTKADDYSFETMTSMRSVDTALEGQILIWEKDYE